MILYKFDKHGGFTVGDTVSKLTGYAFPTSHNADAAKKNPEKVAASMIAKAKELEHLIPAHIRERHNAMHWAELRS